MGKKCILLSDKRTGSTFLQRALNSHPDIVALDELFLVQHKGRERRGDILFKTFQSEKGWNAEKYIKEYIFPKNENVVFRLIYNQWRQYNLTSVIRKMNIPIIHLYRNHLDRTVSNNTQSLRTPKKINLTPKQVLDQVKWSIQKFNQYKKLTKGLKYVEVCYDNMIGETVGKKQNIENLGGSNIVSDQITYLNDEINDRLCEWFGVKYFRMHCNVTKKNSKNIWDYLDNRKEVEKLLKMSGLGDLLD